MKKIPFVFVAVVGFCLGVVAELFFDGSRVEKNTPDANLAYQYYFEEADRLLAKLDVPEDSMNGVNDAKMCLNKALNNQLLEWPEVCDQRDKLSDVIRRYCDNHPESRKEIDEYLMSYFGFTNIDRWAYAY